MDTHSDRGIHKINDRSKRLLATAILSGMALVAISPHDASALTKLECEALGGGTIVEGGQTFCCMRNHGGVDIDCTIPVSGAPGAPAATPLTPAQPTATPPPPPQGSPKPLTPGVKVAPPIQVRKADLIPIANPKASAGPAGFCVKDPTGKLTLYVKNQGVIAAPASKMVVRFLKSTSRPVLLDTHGISAGGTVSVSGIQIPADACSSDCPFTITVDVQKTIDESNEMNNNANGLCLG